MMWHMGEGMGWWMVFGGIVTILFWAGMIALVVWAISALARRDGSRSPSAIKQVPLDIARERYAKGEITKDEFGQMKKDLT